MSLQAQNTLFRCILLLILYRFPDSRCIGGFSLFFLRGSCDLSELILKIVTQMALGREGNQPLLYNCLYNYSATSFHEKVCCKPKLSYDFILQSFCIWLHVFVQFHLVAHSAKCFRLFLGIEVMH